MLYTTYFGKMKKLPEDCIKLVITRFPPKWLDKNKYPPILELAPSEELLMSYKNKLITFEQFKVSFTNEVLRKDNDILMNLGNLSPLQDIAIICFEKPNEFCHRRLIAEFLAELFGLEWKEIE